MNKKLKIIIPIIILIIIIAIISIVVVKYTNKNKDGFNQFITIAFEEKDGKNNYDVNTYSSSSEVKIKKYNLNDQKSIAFNDEIIKDGKKYKIVEILDAAFENHKELVSIKIPKNVREIGQSAFSSCENMKYYELNEDLLVINNAAFFNNKSLETIKLPSKLKRINSYAFQDCFNLESIFINSKLEYLGENVFYNCNKLVEIHYNVNYDENDKISKDLIKVVEKNNGTIKFKDKTISFKK